MSETNDSICLGIGHISNDEVLGKYYQDYSPAIVHIRDSTFSQLDSNGIPTYGSTYKPGLIIQYGLMCHDLILDNIEIKKNKTALKKCIQWLDDNKELYYESIVWFNPENKRYNIKNGWISGMSQGQAISLYLRAYQMFNNESFLDTAKLIYNSFDIEHKDKGFKRIDENNNIWFEEYPTNPPSYVLNGFCYAILGIFDLFRTTKKTEYKEMWDSCIKTISNNLHKYDTPYWSLYDQQKQELVSYYYQKNVHIPLMHILYGITAEPIFNKYANKWEKSLNNSLHRVITKIMYRIKPRIKNIKK